MQEKIVFIGIVAVIAIILVAAGYGVIHAKSARNTNDISLDGSLTTGDSIPNVAITDIEGRSVFLRTLVERTPTLLIFYRGGWCPYCNTHLGKLQEIESELVALGLQIIAVSPDRISELKLTADKHDLGYALYSDSTMLAAKAFGLAFTVDSATITKYKLFGINLEKASGEKHHMLPVPAAFIIDKNGVIRYAHSNADYKERIDPQELLTKAREIGIGIK